MLLHDRTFDFCMSTPPCSVGGRCHEESVEAGATSRTRCLARPASDRLTIGCCFCQATWRPDAAHTPRGWWPRRDRHSAVHRWSSSAAESGQSAPESGGWRSRSGSGGGDPRPRCADQCVLSTPSPSPTLHPSCSTAQTPWAKHGQDPVDPTPIVPGPKGCAGLNKEPHELGGTRATDGMQTSALDAFDDADPEFSKGVHRQSISATGPSPSDARRSPRTGSLKCRRGTD